MTPRVPIGWMHDLFPLTVIGSVQWEDVTAALDVSFDATKGDNNFGWLAVRVSNRGDFGHMVSPDGAFLSVHVAPSRVGWTIADTLVGASAQSSTVPGVLACGVLTLHCSVHTRIRRANLALEPAEKG